jgi:hypothetical protein
VQRSGAHVELLVELLVGERGAGVQDLLRGPFVVFQENGDGVGGWHTGRSSLKRLALFIDDQKKVGQFISVSVAWAARP